MKKLFYLLTIISIVAFTSCDSKPDDLPTSLNASATKSARIIAAAGSTTSAEIIFNKDDFEGLEKYSKWVKRGTIQTSSHLEVKNLPETATNELKLSNVSLSLVSNSKTKVDLPDIAGDQTLSEVKYLNFLQNVIDEVVNKGTSKVRLNYKSSADITSSAEFVIKIDSRFEF